MQHTKLLTVITTALLMSTSITFAQNVDTSNMEYCTVTDKDGNNVVKAGAADCNSMIKMNCKAHNNVAGDSHASILVPKGQCDNVKANHFSEMNADMANNIKSKLDMNRLAANPTVKENRVVNKDVIQGKWTEVKGKLRQQWGKLTDNDIQTMKGSNEELVGKLQKTYGYKKAQAQAEIDSFVKKHNLNN